MVKLATATDSTEDPGPIHQRGRILPEMEKCGAPEYTYMVDKILRCDIDKMQLLPLRPLYHQGLNEDSQRSTDVPRCAQTPDVPT